MSLILKDEKGISSTNSGKTATFQAEGVVCVSGG